MKQIIILIPTIFLMASLAAQPTSDLKRDYIWLAGYDWFYYDVPNVTDGYRFDFKKSPLDTTYITKRLALNNTNASIADTQGNLLFYTNGCSIADAKEEFIVGGERFNDETYWDSVCSDSYGYSLKRAVFILPAPNDTSLFYVFHKRVEYLDNHGLGIDGLRLTQVKYQENSTNLEVISKDEFILIDTLQTPTLTACRHANGRDWWVMVEALMENAYYTFLVTPTGISEPRKQHIGKPSIKLIAGGGSSKFSPDGNSYANFDRHRGLQVFDFDRCSGELSNPRYAPADPLYFDTWGSGVAFSPDSRLLYLARVEYMYQYDLTTDSLAASKDTVAIFDGTSFRGFKMFFGHPQLGPDGKIYVACISTVQAWHVIESPNLRGEACDVKQHQYIFRMPLGRGLPYFPHYRLGALAGSPCDTIRETTNTIQLKDPFQINTYPNPVQTQLTVDLTLPSYEQLGQYRLELRNLHGQLIERRALREFTPLYRFAVADLPRGVYTVNLYRGQEVVASRKVVLR